MKLGWLKLMVCLAVLIPHGLVAEDESSDRAGQLLKQHPEADANRDGVLSREEWKSFRSTTEKSSSGREADSVPRSPMKRYTSEELAKVYEAREYQGLPYRFFAPEGFAESGKAYPLVLSLHGAGGKGGDNLKNLKTWNGVMIEQEFQEAFPCFVVAPQTTQLWRIAGDSPELTEEMITSFPEIWQEMLRQRPAWGETTNKEKLGVVFDLLDELAKNLPIDQDRVYVLGHSMGGFGAFQAIASEPSRFAAAIPSAGGLSPWIDCARLRETPIWAFHGDQDETVPIEMSQVVFEKMSLLSGNMKLTRLANVGHGAAAFAFVYTGDEMGKGFETLYSGEQCDRESNVWRWLFSQNRR